MKKTTKKSKDLPAKGTVKGGGITTANENVTLVRCAKPAKRDLPPKAGSTVKGGRPPTRDHTGFNDNLTLVRAATPTPKPKKDLPVRVSVKGGASPMDPLINTAGRNADRG